MNKDELAEAVFRELLASKKYAHIAEAALLRTAAWAVERQVTTKPAVKAAKTKLHQIHGAFADQVRWDEIDRALEKLENARGDESQKELCTSVLESHASTRERLPILGKFYEFVFGSASPTTTVVDYGCGLNPFTLPWMNLPLTCEYIAADLDTRLTTRVERLLTSLDRPGRVLAVDILAKKAMIAADVALLLKVLPCLEQQEKGAARRLIDSIETRSIVMSFPLSTLGGREVGMETHYSAFVEALDLNARWRIERRKFASELVFILQAR